MTDSHWRWRTPIELGSLLAFVVAFHWASVAKIRSFYAVNMPHYDSVGSLSIGYRILNAYDAGGFAGALSVLANDKASLALSLSQAGFAVVFAPILSKTPDSFQLYNTIAIGCALLALYIFARGQRFGFGTATAFTFVFFLPDGLWWWDFGLLDYRRDPAMFSFLTATFFLLMSGYLGHWEPRPRALVFLLCGVTGGLTLISRDSAPLFVIGTILIPAAVLMALDVRRHGLASAARLVLPAILATLPFAVLLVANAAQVMARLADPLVGFGGGGRRLESLKANARLIDELVRGTWREIGYHTPGSSLTVFGLLACAVFVLAAFRVFDHAGDAGPDRSRLPWTNAILLAAGAWSIVWVHLFLSLYVGWRPTLPFTALAPPYLPALIGVYAAAAVFAGRFAVRGGVATRAALTIAAAASVFVAMEVRVRSRTYDTPRVMIDANAEVGRLTRPDGTSTRIAEMWFDTLQIPMIDNLALQSGLPRPMRVRFGERAYDTAIGIPTNPTERDALLGALERAIRCEADYVIVTTDMARYAQADATLFIFRYARPLVERLLADMPVIRGPYVVPGTPDVVVLDNLARATCR